MGGTLPGLYWPESKNRDKCGSANTLLLPTSPSPHPLPLLASRSSIRGRPQVQGVTPSWLEPRGLLNSDRAAPSKAPGSHLLAAPAPGCPSRPPPIPTTNPTSILKAQSGDTAHPGHTGGEEPANAGDIRDVGSIPGSGRSPGGGHGNPLQCSCLENPMKEEPGGLQSIESQRVGHC